jgi:O-succinylbenzoic acid--CoA ligase
VSFGQLEEEAERLARRLLTLGLGPGAVVGVKGNPDRETITAFHGLWKAGCELAPLNPKCTGMEEARALELMSLDALLLGPDQEAPEGDGEVEHVLSVGPARKDLESLDALRPATGPLPEETGPEGWDPKPAVTLLTSGTSGVPESVTLSFGNLKANAEGSRLRLGLLPEDRWLASLSLAHVGGVALAARCAFLGSALVLRGPFHAQAFRELVEGGEISHASLVPTMFHHFLEVWGNRPSPRTLRCLLIGGAPTPVPLLERGLALGFPLSLTYGLTEATSQVATAPPSLVPEKPGTVGRPLPGVGVELAPDGEILVRGPTVAAGKAGEDGWLRTGDLGRLDGEGDLWVTGRKSHRIISGGVNVDPAEVEAALRTLPGVQDAAVVGVPDPEWGEKVVALVVPGKGSLVVEGELERVIREALSPPKRPRLVRVVAALPRNPNGKVDRQGVLAYFR